MISFSEALFLVLEQAEPLPITQQALGQIHGYVLAQPAITTTHIPRFNNSSRDGYGVRLSEVAQASGAHPVSLKLQHSVAQPGKIITESLAPGSATRVLTGAPIPLGVEAIVMQEVCEEQNGMVLIKESPLPGEHIRQAGAELQQGDVVLPAGLRVTPPVVGMLATLGYRTFYVYRRPRVSLVVTGSELVTPGDALSPGQIYDANSYMLVAALQSLGITDCLVMHARDNKGLLHRQLTRALEESDVVLTVGGVSVGDYDFVKEVCQELGVVPRFWRVAIKPGKPVYFATRQFNNRTQLIFGLPGNPVSTLVVYYQLVVPALRRMMGEREPRPRRVRARLVTDLHKNEARLEFVRGVVKAQDGQLTVYPTRGQESHMLSGLAEANGFIHFPGAAHFLPADSFVDVDMLPWVE